MSTENVRYTNAFVIEVVEQLRLHPSLNDKKLILKEALEKTPCFKDFVQYVLNPHITFGIAKIPEYQTQKGGFYPLAKIFKSKLLEPLITRGKTGKAAELYLTGLLQDLDARDAKALELIINRSLDCGVGADLVNAVSPKLIPQYAVMLCSKYDDKIAESFPFPAYSQIKCDGLRGNIICNQGRIETRSRTGKDLQLTDVFEFVGKSFSKSGFVLDGEVLVRDEANPGQFLPRKQSNGIINKCAKGTATAEEKALVVFVAWDAISLNNFLTDTPMNVPYKDRYVAIKDIVAVLSMAGHKSIQLVETRIVGSLHEAKTHFTNAVERGLEGTILKTSDGIWASGRPKTQLKLKLENECDLFIREAVEGQGKNTGKLGAFKCASADGLLEVSVGSGLSDEQRVEFWKARKSMKGKVVAVKYNEKITAMNGKTSLFLPIFVSVREGIDEKKVADNLADIV